MWICNNSNLVFTVKVQSPEATCQRDLQPKERIRAEEMFFSQGKNTPRYFKMQVLHNGRQIEDRTFIEKNTHVGLLGPNPHVSISFDDDWSPEAKQATEEMVRLVGEKLTKLMQTMQTGDADYIQNKWNSADNEYKFRLFVCYGGMLDENLLDKRARLTQIADAFKTILGIDPSVSVTGEVEAVAAEETRIVVKCKAEMNKDLFIRGFDGNWNKGIPLSLIDDDTWVFSEKTYVSSLCEFKVLQDNAVWQEGSNEKIESGTRGEFKPKFSNVSDSVSAPFTRITVKYDAGNDNQLYLRGNMPGMGNWNLLIPLRKLDKNTWVFDTPEKFTSCEYRLFLKGPTFDGGKWESEENHSITFGKKAVVEPRF